MKQILAITIVLFASVAQGQPGANPPKPTPQTIEQLAAPSGVFIQIAPENMVRNVGGNCAFASVEIIARHQGISELHGFAKGKGGAWPSLMASQLAKYGADFQQVSDRAKGWALIREALEAGQPALFSVPGHALVCCGHTKAGDKEYVWVIDNTGSEGGKVKGWTKSEFDRRFDGWALRVNRCRPGFCPTPQPKPSVKPTPHIDPSPDVVPTVFPTAPPVIEPKKVPPPVIQSDLGPKLDKLLERIEEVAKIKAAPGPAGKDGLPGLPGLNGKDGRDGRDGKDADGAELATLRKEIAVLQAEQAAQRATLANLQGSFIVEVAPRK